MSLSEIAVSYSRLQWIQSFRPAGSTRPVLYSCPSHNIRRIIIMERGGVHTLLHSHTHAGRHIKTPWERTDRDEYHISILGCGCHSKCGLYLSWVDTVIEGWNPSSQTKKDAPFLPQWIFHNILNKSGSLHTLHTTRWCFFSEGLAFNLYSLFFLNFLFYSFWSIDLILPQQISISSDVWHAYRCSYDVVYTICFLIRWAF